MKLAMRMSFLLVFLLGVIAVHGVKAQIPADGLKFKTAFPFVVGTDTLPAGEYWIKPSQDDIDVLSLAGQGHSIFTYCEELESLGQATKSEITFNKYGNTRFLKQILVSGSTQGCLIATGSAEKKAKKSGKGTKETVETK